MRIESARLVKNGEKQAFSFSASADELAVDCDGVSFDGEVRVAGSVCFTGAAYRVEGAVSVTKNFVCDRCLTPVKRDETYTFCEDFSADAHDETFLLAPDGAIDLDDAVRETIIAAQPPANYCRDDCLGLCPVCGHNLNDGDCRCDRQIIDPRLAILKDFFA